MMKKRLFKHLLVLLLSAAAPVAFAANEGTAVGVDPDAKAQINSTDRILEVGADVSVGEKIVTGPSGLVQIVFDDDTRLVVGPRSSLLIENYLMASSNTAQQLTVNALGGSFRFITGNSPKPAYSIRTPTAAIAVRGTEFDIVVEPGNTKVMLYEGALEICNSADTCQQVTRKCEVAVASNNDASLFVRSDPLRTPLSLEFRYARFQAPLLAPFRVGGAALCAEEPQVNVPKGNMGSEDDGPLPTTPPPRPPPPKR
ncbi:FecR domain-containing protein [Devosia oryziradicis]|uniref:FecR domain-containing protein n=1 Tax=Devosia oryziradicis TaxID=2801335 RepID=A0ABX7BUF4_9HYPH|nr:FecR domain-containing protein [Devosia oryziradicis]QQR35177.1 FecR domain-containing protein [Devosia oryziradicis]